MTDNTELARQAPAPVEVSRLVEAFRALMHVRDFHPATRAKEDVVRQCEGILASMASTPVGEVPAGWVSISDERKPPPHAPVLVSVEWIRHGEDDDGKPHSTTGVDVTEGEYVPPSGDGDGHFESYQGTHYDGSSVTHWMPLPAAPGASPAPAASKGAEAVICVACEGKPAAENSPCAVCKLAAPSEPEAQKAVADWYERRQDECAKDYGEYDESAPIATRLRWWVPKSARFGRLQLEDDLLEAAEVLASPSPAASMEVQGLDANAIRLAALEEAARACEKLAEERFNDHGIREPDTGACYYGGRVEEEYQTRDEEDDECAKAIRALAAKNGWRLGEGRG